MTAALLAGADPERLPSLGLTQAEVDALWEQLDERRRENLERVDRLQFVIVCSRATPGWKALPTW